MDCTDAQYAISEALDEGRRPPSDARRHLEACPACAEFARRVESMDRLLSDGTADQVPGEPGRPFLSDRRLVAAASIAAVLAIGAAVGVVWQSVDHRPAQPIDPGSTTASTGLAGTGLDAAGSRTARTAEALVEPWRQEVLALRRDARRTAAALLDYAPAPGLSAVGTPASNQPDDPADNRPDDMRQRHRLEPGPG